MNIETIENAQFITIGRDDSPDKGLWKILKKIFLRDEHGVVLVARMTVDKDLSKAGDEKIVEWQQEAAREITVLSIIECFPQADAESWPPPREISANNVVYRSLNTQGGPHDPFTGFVGHQLISHWEYQDETGQKFLQIFQDTDNMVYMSTGYVINEAYVKIV